MIDIEKNLPTVFTQDKHVLYEIGDVVDSVFYIEQGLVKTLTDKGKVINFYKTGDMVALSGCLTQVAHQERAICVGKVEMKILPKKKLLLSLQQNKDYVLELFSRLNSQIEEYNQRTVIVLQQKVELRLIKMLLFLKEKFGLTKTRYINALISPNDLASLVCTTRTTIYRTLTSLKNKGVIKVSNGMIRLNEQLV